MWNSAIFDALTLWDALALAIYFGAWNAATWYVERGPKAAQGVAALVHERRLAWMLNARRREVRIADAQMINTLQNGTAFFASAALLAVGGAVAMLGQIEKLAMIAEDLPIGVTTDRAAWEIKLLLMTAMLIVAFLKFAWAHRLYSYKIVILGSMPEAVDPDPARSDLEAAETGRLAARSFNRGLRTLYFTLAAIAWLLGPLALFIGTMLVAHLIHRREFRSESRKALLGGD